MRLALVRLHRWIGLASALFLSVAGLTGSLLAYKNELEALINPRLFVVEPPEGAALLDPFVLRAKVEARFSGGRVDYMPLSPSGASTQSSARFFLWPHPAAAGASPAPPLEMDEVFFDPYTGDYLGGRKWGVLFEGGVFYRENLMPFVWRLHEALALPHPWGKLFMGVIALVWTLDCFIGMVLTWPGKSPFFAKWKLAWSIKRGASAFRRMFDLHRSLGLWFWLLLLVFAWSSVMLNLRAQVYQPLMSLALRFDDRDIRRLPSPDFEPRIGWRAAHAIGRSLLHSAAEQRRMEVRSEDSLWYRPALGAYLYRASTDMDIGNHAASSDIWIDGRNGQVISVNFERNAAQGNVVSGWLRGLHTGDVFGPYYRALVALLGVLLATLCVSGAWIWWKKRVAKANPKRTVTSPGRR